jgi:chromosome partitioning protein
VHGEGTLPEPQEIRAGRRYYTARDIWNARQILEQTSRKKGRYLPGRRDGDKLQVWQLMNFKGGSSKSTTTIHLAHFLALQGYKVLAVDLDPQGSLTSMCGISPEIEFDGLTVYDAIRYDDPVPFADTIVGSVANISGIRVARYDAALYEVTSQG